MSSLVELFKKALRDRLNVRGAQAKLAQSLGVKPAQVSKLLKTKDPSLSTVDKYAKALGCEPWELLRPAEALGEVLNEKRAADDRAAEQAPSGEASQPEKYLRKGIGSQGRGSSPANDHEAQQGSVDQRSLHAPSSADVAAILSRLDRIEDHLAAGTTPAPDRERGAEDPRVRALAEKLALIAGNETALNAIDAAISGFLPKENEPRRRKN